MSFTLANIRADVRVMLKEPAALNYTDAEIDDATARAVDEFQLRFPRERTASIVSTGVATHTFNAADRLAVVAVEYPLDQQPRAFIPFDYYDTTITTTTQLVPSGATLRVYYDAEHVLHASDPASTTMLADSRLIIATGSLAHVLDAHASTVDTIHIGGPRAAQLLGDRALAARQRFKRLMDSRRGGRKLGVRQMFSPDARQLGHIGPSQTTDPGP